MQKARAIHDREMVEKTNEIKRVCGTSYREGNNYHLLNCLERDNMIKQHEARIAQLENVLARRIYNEVGEIRFGVLTDPNMQNYSLGRHPQKALTNKVTQWPSMSQGRKNRRAIISQKPAALDTRDPRPTQFMALLMRPP